MSLCIENCGRESITHRSRCRECYLAHRRQNEARKKDTMKSPQISQLAAYSQTIQDKQEQTARSEAEDDD